MDIKGNVFIPAPHGQLEGIYRPENLAAERVALVLHPLPTHGGTMHNKVVARAAKALQAAGYETLRFNFRGAGYSTGTFDNGVGESEDARLALDYLLRQQPQAKEIMVAGFSFGSAIGLRVGCADPRVTRLLALGAPERWLDPAMLLACHKPKLFIHATADVIAPFAPMAELIASLPPANQTQFVPIADAGHFFEGKLDEMMQIITHFAAQVS